MRWLLLIVLLTGCSALPVSSSTPQADRVPAGTLDAATARTSLAALPVAAPGRLDGYVRDCDDGKACVFGQPWFDADGDGCDQRSQVLARDLTNVERKPGRCGVQSGTLDDPYTGSQISGTSKIQIDHVVPLAEMWRSGAAAWAPEQRVAAANDLRNLVAVSGKVNQSKSDKTPDKWMPPNAGYACSYSRMYVTVKTAYGLSVAPAERTALEKALASCG
ncbi:HNH endonuclease family protein [Lentzea sp.]|uniref:HNH endonuclease family protein n=1 Tax=Lentzea sp. TaxID=56099 RepID=UPI002BB29BDB|nr:HNH endonuclease family protein [Lentzea sp.]HUQ58115.1 HNH endonuclease family protein [Lentzea sp.]